MIILLCLESICLSACIIEYRSVYLCTYLCNKCMSILVYLFIWFFVIVCDESVLREYGSVDKYQDDGK